MLRSNSLFKPKASTAPTSPPLMEPDSIFYGTVILKDANHQSLTVNIVESNNTIYAKTLDGKSLGSLFYEKARSTSFWEDTRYYVIRSFYNHTHNKSDTPKVHGIGSLLMECVVAHCINRSFGLSVQASSSHLAYRKLGFKAEGEIPAFKDAHRIYDYLKCEIPLGQIDKAQYEEEKKICAQKTRKNPDSLTPKEVCFQSIHSVLTKCAEEKSSLPDEIKGVVLMRLLENGIHPWKQRILSSTLHHDPSLIEKLENELLAKIHTLPHQAIEKIASFLRR